MDDKWKEKRKKSNKKSYARSHINVTFFSLCSRLTECILLAFFFEIFSCRIKKRRAKERKKKKLEKYFSVVQTRIKNKAKARYFLEMLRKCWICFHNCFIFINIYIGRSLARSVHWWNTTKIHRQTENKNAVQFICSDFFLVCSCFNCGYWFYSSGSHFQIVNSFYAENA